MAETSSTIEVNIKNASAKLKDCICRNAQRRKPEKRTCQRKIEK